MGLRSRIMLLVTIGLLVATIPLGVMGLGMVRAATDRVLEERLSLTRMTAGHLGQQLAVGWSQLDQIAARLSAIWNQTPPRALQQALVARAGLTLLFSGGLFLVDRSGTLLAQDPAPPGLRIPSLAHSPTLQAVLLTRTPQTSGIEHTVDGRPIVFLAVPVRAPTGRALGAVGGVIDLSKPTLLAFISGVAQGVSGHAAIVGRDGLVLASTDEGELFTRNEHPDSFTRFIAAGRPLVGSTRDHGAGVSSEMHVMAFAPIESVPWGLGIGQTEEETFGPIRRLQDRIVVFEVLVLIAALMFAWLDTGAVATPLGVLREASERIAGGDLDSKIEVRRGDEIGSLARSFETMRLQLRRSLEENARLQERLRSVAMVEERERIAREIHDSVGQVLGYVNTKAQAVTALLESGKMAQARTQLAQLEQAARDVYADLREAILGLRAATGSNGQLVVAVTEYAERFSGFSGVDVRVLVEGDPARYAFGPTTELHLLRIIQEALTNVRKHARARSARVRFSADADTVRISIIDDGAGLQSAAQSPGRPLGFGLQMMRERAEAVGGTFSVTFGNGGGTHVQVQLPAAERGMLVAGPAR